MVRLVNFDSDGVSLFDPGAVQAWIDEKVLEAIQFGFDGANLDFESVIPPESEEVLQHAFSPTLFFKKREKNI